MDYTFVSRAVEDEPMESIETDHRHWCRRRSAPRPLRSRRPPTRGASWAQPHGDRRSSCRALPHLSQSRSCSSVV